MQKQGRDFRPHSNRAAAKIARPPHIRVLVNRVPSPSVRTLLGNGRTAHFPQPQKNSDSTYPMHTKVKTSHSTALLFFAAFLAFAGTAALAENYDVQSQIASINSQIKQYKVDIETQKLAQLNDKARNDQRSSQYKEQTIKRYQDAIEILQMELAVCQQQLNFEKQPRSPNPGVASYQTAIQQLTIEKARLGILQAKARKANNTSAATMYGQQMEAKQQQIQIKQQELKIFQLQQNVNVNG